MKKKEMIFFSLIIIGIILVAIPISINMRANHIEHKIVDNFKNTIKDSSSDTTNDKVEVKANNSKENREEVNAIALLNINSIGLDDAPIVDGEKHLNYTIGKYSNTPDFGAYGNVVLAAHNNMAGSIFRHLKDTSNGEIIKIQTKYMTYKYKIEKKYIVEPNDSSVMDQDLSKQEITLITCTNHAKQRLIVQGYLVT